MASEVEICNLALSNIRAGSINSLDEESAQSQLCKLKYPILRDMLLTEIPWSFNRSIRALSVVTTEIFTWAYAYQYPVDCLKIERLIPNYEELANADADVISRQLDSQLLPLKDRKVQVPYEVFNFSGVKLIGANEPELRIDYAMKVTDPNLFTNNFILAFSHLMSGELAIPLIGAETGRQLRSDEFELYSAYLAAAVTDDINDQYHSPALSEFETIRR